MYEHKNFVFVLEFDEEDEDDDEFIRKWSKDHTTLLPGSDVFSPKKHIFAEYVWTQYFCVYFSQKKLLAKAEDNFEDTLMALFLLTVCLSNWLL